MSAHPAAEPAAHAHGHPSPAADEPRRPWTVFALAIAAQFMVILDVSVVDVALPSISESLQMSAADSTGGHPCRPGGRTVDAVTILRLRRAAPPGSPAGTAVAGHADGARVTA